MADEKQGDVWAQIVKAHRQSEGYLSTSFVQDLAPETGCCPFLCSGRKTVDAKGDRSHLGEKALVDLRWDLGPTYR